MYQALARKYRPQTFADVVGQEHITVTLTNALQADRLHHAYLFCGARGVGKTSVARVLAKAINCRDRSKDGDPCNTCSSCVEITESRSLDVREIDGASNTGVDDVREIREQLKYVATGDLYKIYIIDEVHMLSTAAFNALLKTLEEPPPNVMFMFATTEPHKIPATILSRCQRYDFRRIGATRIIDTLSEIAKQEGYSVSDDVLQLIAFEAEGGLRDAESLLDQAVAFAGNDVTLDKVRQLLGFTDRTTIRALVAAICTRDANAALQQLDAVFQSGGNLPRLAQDVLESFRHLWVVASCKTFPNPDALPAEDVAIIEQTAATVTVEECQQWFHVLFHSIDDVIRGRFPKLALEAVVLKMVQVGPVTSVAALLNDTEIHASSPANPQPLSSPVPSAQPSPPAPSQSAIPSSSSKPSPSPSSNLSPSPSSSSNSDWASFFTWLKTEHARLAAIIEHGTVTACKPPNITLQFPVGSFYAEMLKEVDRADHFRGLLCQRFGEGCDFTITTDDGPSITEKRAKKKADRAEYESTARDQALHNDVVRDAARILGAEVKEVRVRPKG